MNSVTTPALPHKYSLLKFWERLCTKESKCLPEICLSLSLGWLWPSNLRASFLTASATKSYWTKVELQTQAILGLICVMIWHFFSELTTTAACYSTLVSQLHFHSTLLSGIWKMAGKLKANNKWFMLAWAKEPMWSAITSQTRVQAGRHEDTIKWVGHSHCQLDKINQHVQPKHC